MGNNVYANFNLMVVDDGEVFIGDKVLFGPNVTIATANHPIEPSLRENAMQYNKAVHIGDNVWIGAESVVVKDIPDNVVAVGNPCHVLRKIGEHDCEFFYKNEKIDWENL